MFTLSYSFRPWPHAAAIAGGRTILTYIRDTAREFGVDRRIRFGHKVRSAAWSSAEARWTLEVEAGRSGAQVQVTCGFLIVCAGYYSYEGGYRPDFPGLETLRRPNRRSAALDRRRRLFRQAGAGDRQRRDGGDDRPGARPPRRPCRDAAAIADLRDRARLARRVRRRVARGAARAARLPARALGQHRRRRRLLPLLPALPARGAMAAAGAGARRAGAGRRRDEAFHAALRAVGPAAVPDARRRSVSRFAQRPRLDRHRHDRNLHRDRRHARQRRNDRGRHCGRRHRPRAAAARRQSASASTERRSNPARRPSSRAQCWAACPISSSSSATPPPPGR